jgi:hypothetical protein
VEDFNMAHSSRIIGTGIVALALLVPTLVAAERNTGSGPKTYACPGVERTCGAWAPKGENTCRTCQQAQCKAENGQDVLAGNKTTTECYQGHDSPPPAKGAKKRNRTEVGAATKDAVVQPVEGAVVEGNQIKALPGYTLEPGPKNQVMIRKSGSGPGGQGHTFPGCGCKGGDGTCTVETNSGGTGGSCGKRADDTCTGTCTFNTGGPVPTGGILRAQ